jgi:hypothetical protein
MRAFRLELTPEQREFIRRASGAEGSSLRLELEASHDSQPLTFYTESQGRLGEFLLSLGLDLAKLCGFLRDPEQAMEAAELSNNEKIVLRSGNSIQVHEAVLRERPLVLLAPLGRPRGSRKVANPKARRGSTVQRGKSGGGKNVR